MKRIFLALSCVTTLFLAAAIVLGLRIGDANVLNANTQAGISTHMLVGMGGLSFALLIHALCFTYFMGTGRWLEETSNAYSLGNTFYEASQKIKYGTLKGMGLCFVLLIGTAALGAVADPATPMTLNGLFGLQGAQFHFLAAITASSVNVIVNFSEFIAISRNSSIVDSVLEEVRRIRLERGLPV